jgi:hypothetical protein
MAVTAILAILAIFLATVKGRQDNDTVSPSDKEFERIQLLEEFFNPSIAYQRLPPHTVEQSPCYPIIIIEDEEGKQSYHCKLHCHEGYGNTDLDTIEYHCKTKDPELHKTEILRLLNEEEEIADAITTSNNNSNNNILYSQIILRNSINNQQQR